MKKLLLLSSTMSLLAFNAIAQQRVPLFEVFSSSTCGPCNPGNAVYKGVVSDENKGNYVGIKFQQDFPGTGDPYCTNETYGRRSYYAINSIPRMEIDGAWDKNAQSFTQALYDASRAVAPKFSISGSYTITTANKVTVKVKYSPLVAVPTGTKLYVAIIEDSTVQNIKSNGETKFYNVVKKMMPDQNGTIIADLAVNGKDSTSLTFDFVGAFRLPTNGQAANRINHTTEHSVENFANLRVVAWIQGNNKEVYQAAHIYKPSPAGIGELAQSFSDVAIYPNPANTTVSVDLTAKSIDLISAKLVGMSGATVATQTAPCMPGKNTISFNTANLANGVYNLIVSDSRNNSYCQRVFVAH